MGEGGIAPHIFTWWDKLFCPPSPSYTDTSYIAVETGNPCNEHNSYVLKTALIESVAIAYV